MKQPQAINTFELRFFIDHDAQEKIVYGEGNVLVCQEIWIDGHHIDEPYAVSLIYLMRSLFYPGEFFIFTCDCGEPYCANIEHGIFVRHEPGLIRWRFRRPVKWRDFVSESGCDYDNWAKNAPWVECVFDRNQMLGSIAGALEAIRIQADFEVRYSPFGFTRSDLDALNPYGRLSDVPNENGTGRSLFFLADEENQFLLDGCFVDLNVLGLSEPSQRRFQDWLQKTRSRRLDSKKRLKWLKDSIMYLIDAYLEADTKLWLINHHWREDGTLDHWDQERFAVAGGIWMRDRNPTPKVCIPATI
jgi:hypothetical protein